MNERNKVLNVKSRRAGLHRGPGLFTDAEAKPIATQVIADLKHFAARGNGFEDFYPSMDTEIFDGCVHKLIVKYIANTQYDNSIPRYDFKKDVKVLKSALGKVEKAIGSLRREARAEIEHILNRGLWYDNRNRPPHSIPVLEEYTKHVLGACSAITSTKGKKEKKTAVRSACEGLWTLREQATKAPFTRNFEIAKTGHAEIELLGKKQFVRPDPLFVQAFFRTMDPEISLSELRTALKDVAKQRGPSKSMSK